jgi:SAM-dependent methyltransferase
MPAISDLGFTSHNILLPDGRETLPGRPLIAQDPACRALLRTAERLVPPIGERRPRVVDLGCLEGGYAVEFARAGYDVVGIEVRVRNFERSEAVARELGLPNLRFVRDDARNIGAHGEFDIVLCLGLLYHLDRPATFLATVGALTRQLLLLNTHYATASECKHYALSALTTHDGKRGRWFEEYADGISDDALEEHAWASFGNPKSFWLEKGALLSTLIESGFPTVFEEFDFLSPLEDTYALALEHQRGLFVGLK